MNWGNLGQAGFVMALTLAAMGSAFGTGAAGLAAVGAWKKCLIEKRSPPFILVAFAGAPLSQTIYGMILMNTLRSAPDTVGPVVLFAAGLFGGISIGLSAWLQGQVGAAAADALAGTGQGFGHYMMVLGIIETVALFVMVFLMTTVK
jgi:V/A-type H+/Na+-transporting ATPase subunit K